MGFAVGVAVLVTKPPLRNDILNFTHSRKSCKMKLRERLQKSNREITVESHLTIRHNQEKVYQVDVTF